MYLPRACLESGLVFCWCWFLGMARRLSMPYSRVANAV